MTGEKTPGRDDEETRFRAGLEAHLDAIQREETPQRLLELAKELQRALRAQK